MRAEALRTASQYTIQNMAASFAQAVMALSSLTSAGTVSDLLPIKGKLK